VRGDAVSEYVTPNSDVCVGKPVLRDPRIMVSNILGMVADKCTVDRILEEYPESAQTMVQAALEYAAAVLDEE